MVVVVAALGTMGIGAGPAAAATSSSAHHATKPVKLTQLGHGTFWECSAQTTAILIGLNRLELHPGQPLVINFFAKNMGSTACNYVAPYTGSAPGATSTTLQVGPCGEMGFEIEGSHHRNIWPGVEAFNCPALGFAQLQPGSTVAGAGTWDQTLPSGSKRVHAGTYTLVVDGHFSFPLHIEAH
jgi:hypothetical protein